MHETLIARLKFNLDQFIKSANNTYVLEGWILGEIKPVEAIQVGTTSELKTAFNQFTIRPDVNEFYGLPEQIPTGFKFTFTANADEDVDFLIFRVKFKGETQYEVFAVIENEQSEASTPISPPPLPEFQSHNHFPGLVVVDNFYKDPDAVREYAMQQEFAYNKNDHKGRRTQRQFLFDGLKTSFESILQRRITNWETHAYNGVFQYCIAEDSLVYHSDPQSYAAMIFLTPDAPPETGTSFYKSRYTGLTGAPTDSDCKRLRKNRDELITEMYNENFYDKTRWELIETVANVYNRLIFFDAQRVHSAAEYFGNNLKNGRLFQIFFFDTESL